MSPFATYVPDDFDDFWAEIQAEAEHAPLDFHRSTGNDFDLPGFVVHTLTFRGVRGETLHGWIAGPEGARHAPAFVWIPPYGRESLLPNRYGTREGFVSLSLNFHGHGPFHQEKYTPNRGYFAEGAASPETWIFRAMIQNVLIATRVLESQLDVDEDRLGVMGMSQGGGLAIWTGVASPRVKAVVADMPFLGPMPYNLARNAYRYPLKELVDFMEREPLGREKLFHTLSYFDTVNVATRCTKPTLVSYGEKDPACRPEAVEAIYASLPGVKELVAYPGGHDWDEGMVQRNRDWLDRHLP